MSVHDLPSAEQLHELFGRAGGVGQRFWRCGPGFTRAATWAPVLANLGWLFEERPPESGCFQAGFIQGGLHINLVTCA